MSLDVVLMDAVQRAIKFNKSFVMLGHGLVVDIRLVDACTLELKLSRRDQLPSIVEWGTVCKYFPWPIKAEPTTNEVSLIASFPIHPKYLPNLQAELGLDYTRHSF